MDFMDLGDFTSFSPCRYSCFCTQNFLHLKDRVHGHGACTNGRGGFDMCGSGLQRSADAEEIWKLLFPRWGMFCLGFDGWRSYEG